MNEFDRKTRIRNYKNTAIPAGVYRVRNTALGKSLVGASVNLPGMLNRQRFQLQGNSHPDGELQRDWNEFGAGVFVFDVLDRLEPKDDPAYDPTDDLDELVEMWREKLVASGEVLYPYSQRKT